MGETGPQPADHILFIDTETTGVFNRTLPYDHPAQPRLVQLGCLLTTDLGREVSSASLMVQPDGWTIPDGSARVHGITTEIAMSVGLPLSTVASVYSNMRARAAELVAFNIDFDRMVMENAFARLGTKPRHPGPARSSCCMALSAGVVNLPPTPRMIAAGFTGPKSPTLAQAYEFLFRTPLHDAHDALADARACARIYFELKRRLTADAAA